MCKPGDFILRQALSIHCIWGSSVVFAKDTSNPVKRFLRFGGNILRLLESWSLKGWGSIAVSSVKIRQKLVVPWRLICKKLYNSDRVRIHELRLNKRPSKLKKITIRKMMKVFQVITRDQTSLRVQKIDDQSIICIICKLLNMNA